MNKQAEHNRNNGRIGMRAAFAIGALAMLSFQAGAATTGHLLVDGILKVKGGSLAGARMIMVDERGTSVVMESGLDHFAITMDLNSRYVMEFQRPGCVTKQVLFDTSVPSGDAIFQEYSFPFEVTLQAPPAGQRFEYAGPVALVHYVTGKADFGYDIDYRTKAPAELMARLEDARKGTKVARTPTHRATVVTSDPRHAEAEMPLVHVTGTPEAAPVRRERPAAMSSAAPAEVKRTDLPAAKPVDAATAHVPTRTAGMAPAPAKAPVRMERAPEVAPVVEELAPSMAAGVNREEEVLVDGLRITHIVRLRTGGKVTEYRRVETKYGQVYHFRDGQNVPATVYATAVKN